MLIDASLAKPGEKIMTFQMTENQARWLQGQLSDAGCWMTGFEAALGDENASRAPMGHSGITELNIALKKAMETIF